MVKTRTPKSDELLKAVKDSFGLKMVIARLLKTDLATLNRCLEKNSRARAAYNEEIERVKDMVEAEIIFQCQEGNVRMLMFFAKTKMRDRGYVERSELTGADGESLLTDQQTRADLSNLGDDHLRLLAQGSTESQAGK